jgi:hypothetical protein
LPVTSTYCWTVLAEEMVFLEPLTALGAVPDLISVFCFSFETKLSRGLAALPPTNICTLEMAGAAMPAEGTAAPWR